MKRQTREKELEKTNSRTNSDNLEEDQLENHELEKIRREIKEEKLNKRLEKLKVSGSGI